MSDWRAVHCWCLLSIALAGCDAPPQEYANVLVRDSAGVSIVENRAPVSEDWTVDPDPLLQLGVVEGDSAYAFTAVRQAVRSEDGRLLVVDRGCYCVRVFSADGKAIGRIGRFGEGPGEFSTDPLIRSAGGGGIVAWDDRQLRLSWFSADGTLQKDSMLINVVRNARVTQISGGTTWRITSSGDLFSVSGNLVLDEQTRCITASRPVLLPLGGGTIPFGEYKHAAQLFVRRADGASIGVASPFVVSPIVELLPAHDQVVVSNTSDWQLSFDCGTGL